MTIKETMRKNEEEFDSAFMNNGVNGVLDDKFQDDKMLIINKFFKQSQQSLLKAVIEEVEKQIQIERASGAPYLGNKIIKILEEQLTTE